MNYGHDARDCVVVAEYEMYEKLNELFNEKKRIVMIRHIELVDRKTEIAYADKYVDEEQYAEYRRLSIDGDFYVRIVEE